MLCASKRHGKLYWVIDGKIQRSFDARFGRPGYPSDEGTFRVYYKNAHAQSTMFSKKPVPMPFAMFYNWKQQEGIHYSGEFAANTNPRGSHGCINLRDYEGARWLYNQVRINEKVVVY